MKTTGWPLSIFLPFCDDRQRNTFPNDYTITYTPIVDVAGFADKDLPPSRHQPHPLLLCCRLPLPRQLGVVIDGLPLTPGLYPRFPLHWLQLPLPFHHSPLVPDGFTPGIILKQTRLTAFNASRRSQKNDSGELPVFP